MTIEEHAVVFVVLAFICWIIALSLVIRPGQGTRLHPSKWAKRSALLGVVFFVVPFVTYGVVQIHSWLL